MTTLQRRLRGWDEGHWADWVVPAVVASLWAVLLAAGADVGLATRRGLVFVGGPVLLLSGLHARLTGYLHAPSRAQLLVLPLPPSAHFSAARARHVRALAETLALGSLAVLAGFVPTVGWPGTVPLVLDWAALAVVAVLFEPMIPAVSAALGRRFDPESSIGEVQRRASGGWTQPETSVHLYAPALGVGCAAAAAMPLQLAFDLSADGRAVPMGLWGVGIGMVAIAALAFVVAPQVYARGVFEAVPFVAEATRTLAGPPIPEPTPTWIARLRDPVLRLLVLSFWRETPAPMFRLLGLSAATVMLGGSSSVPVLAVWVSASLLWIVPATTLARTRPLRARMLATLPVPPRQRDGTHPGATALLIAPVALGFAVLGVRLIITSTGASA